jgi:hypothetical protein
MDHDDATALSKQPSLNGTSRATFAFTPRLGEATISSEASTPQTRDRAEAAAKRPVPADVEHALSEEIAFLEQVEERPPARPAAARVPARLA